MKQVLSGVLLVALTAGTTPLFADSVVMLCDASTVIITDNDLLQVVVSDEVAPMVNMVVWDTTTTLNSSTTPSKISLYCADGNLSIGYDGINVVEVEVTLQTGAQIKQRSQ